MGDGQDAGTCPQEPWEEELAPWKDQALGGGRMTEERKSATPSKDKRKGAEEKEKREEDIVEERVYTIPLRRAWIAPIKNRSPRAVRIIQTFLNRHMRPETLVITPEVNEQVWSRGIEKPPRRIRVRATKNKDGVVTVYLAQGE